MLKHGNCTVKCFIKKAIPFLFHLRSRSTLRSRIESWTTSRDRANSHQAATRFSNRKFMPLALKLVPRTKDIINEGEYVDTISVDNKEAFDTVPHDHGHHLKKLKGFGIEGRILNWVNPIPCGGQILPHPPVVFHLPLPNR